MRATEATLICRRRMPEATENIDGLTDLYSDYEVVGLAAPDGSHRQWRTFLEDTPRYYGELVTRQLRWPAQMLGSLATFAPKFTRVRITTRIALADTKRSSSRKIV